MPANSNPRVTELLDWHGHAAGGVHVPFQARKKPLGSVIETSLVTRLRALATGIAQATPGTPRWVFLVGGPGNGKSETVQDFLIHLDAALGLGGALQDVLARRFTPPGLVPRKVEIVPADLGTSGRVFGSKISKLIIVQDATATDSALGNAASELAHEVADLLTSPSDPPAVFVACANRGLLARAMNEAFFAYGASNDVTQIIAHVIQVCSLGRETLERHKPCWPMELDSRIACWPLDIESLLAGGRPTSMELVIEQAVAANDWEVAGRCQDCSSRELCPFRQNAEWLRADATRAHLVTMLRHGELARGQRWNFRDAFSLVAELVVGQWSDFSNELHPCAWVHQNVAAASSSPPAVGGVVSLAMQLYPSALFRSSHVRDAATGFLEKANPAGHPLTFSLMEAIAGRDDRSSAKAIRDVLRRDYLRLDPATYTPWQSSHPLRIIEDAFCQSIEQGRTALQSTGVTSPAMVKLLEVFEAAEREWDLLGRESATASGATCLILKLAAMTIKRLVGLHLGHHALEEMLSDYEACLRDAAKLGVVRDALQPLLGGANFSFNLVEILGQPTAEERAGRRTLVALQGQAPGLRVLPAPGASAVAPGHDVPCIEITDPNYRIPLTFDFYLTLMLRKRGCAGSSLPASVRAALDRVRHRYAGHLCRHDDRFVDGRASIILGTQQKVTLAGSGEAPTLVES